MADIELVIKIPEGLKNDFESEQWTALSCMEMKDALEKATQLPKGHGRIGDLSELETRIGNFIEHYNNLLKETNPEALVYMNHILDGIIDTDTIIEADKESEDKE